MENFHAISIASKYPDRVAACIFTNLYYDPQTEKNQKGNSEKYGNDNNDDKKPMPDPFEIKNDGSHLVELHNKRNKWLDPELNLRVVQTELTYLVNRRVRYSKGISINYLSGYDFEERAQNVVCPTLCIRGESALTLFDTIGLNGTAQFEKGTSLFKDTQIVSMEGPKSTINMINQAPEEFSECCQQFLNAKGI